MSWIEIFGYVASIIIAFSLTRSSIVQLRWINLFGASSFCVYGIIIGAYPVAILNGFITLTNIYYIRKFVYHTNHNFKVLKTQSSSHYLDFFFDYHKQEIDRFFPRFFKKHEHEDREFYVLLDGTQVVGLIAGIKKAGAEFVVDFDFVIPEYRDCRLGEFALGDEQALKLLTGYDQIGATADSVEHEQYLEKLGFSPNKFGIWFHQSTAR